MTTSRIRPRPAASWVIRCFGVEPPVPKATMCEDWMLAPALVPPTTTPRRWAALMASPNAVPLTIADSLSWLPPVMKMPVTSSSVPTCAGSSASSRLSGRAATTSRAPRRRNSASYTSTTSGPSELAVGTTAIFASSPPASETNVLSTVRRPSLSSAPPIAISAPGTVCARCPSAAGSLSTGPLGMRRSLRGARVDAVTDRRCLIVMRHAKAEPFASSDHARTLTDRGLASARDAGAHLRDTKVSPDHAVVSSAVRTRQTWEAVVEVAGFTGSAEVALEVLQAVPEDARSVMFVGHNPTAAFLCHYLDDGEGDPAAVSAMLRGFPPGAVALLELSVRWSELGSETGRVTDFYVGQG